MEKVIINNKNIPVISKKINVFDEKISIEIKTVIELSDIYNIISAFISKYYSKSDYMVIGNVKVDIIGAEIILRLAVLAKQTNIDIGKIDDNLVLNDVFYEQISENIENYRNMKILLFDVLEANEKEYDSGRVIKGFTDKVSEFLEKLEDMDTEKLVSEARILFDSVNKPTVKRKRKQHETENLS